MAAHAARWQHLGTRFEDRVEKTCFKPCAKDVYLLFQHDELYFNLLGGPEGSATVRQHCHTSRLRVLLLVSHRPGSHGQGRLRMVFIVMLRLASRHLHERGLLAFISRLGSVLCLGPVRHAAYLPLAQGHLSLYFKFTFLCLPWIVGLTMPGFHTQSQRCPMTLGSQEGLVLRLIKMQLCLCSEHLQVGFEAC